MDITEIKTYFFLALMLGLLIVAITMQDRIGSELFASLGIIVGTFISASLSEDDKAEK